MKTLIEAILAVESEHFRTVEDTGANPNALIVMNAMRRQVGLVPIFKDDLAAYDTGSDSYKMPENSKLLTNIFSK